MSAPPGFVTALIKGLRNETEETEDVVRYPHSLPSSYTFLLICDQGPGRRLKVFVVLPGGFLDALALL